MRAAVHRAGAFRVEEIELPALGPRQLRVRPIAAGICGTDLSAWEHTDDFLSSLARFGADHFLFDPTRPLVFGHEFTSEVLEVGAEVSDFKTGDVIFTSPVVMDGDRFMVVGFSNNYPGGLAEQAIVEAAAGHIKLADGVDPVHAAMLDPVSTGINGVMRTGVGPGQTALVTGVGPVGLGAVVELKARGVEQIVVSDPSAQRRAIAQEYGASVVLDPFADDPLEACKDLMDPATRLAVVEASGAPGLLTRLMDAAPKYTVFAVMGATSRSEEVYPMGATTTNLTMTFASGPDHGDVGYPALERGHDLIAQRAFDPSRMITAYTGLPGVGEAFRALRPQDHAIEQVKILIVPDLDAEGLLTPEEFATRA